MLKELKMLFSLRAWWKSTALKAGGIVGVLGAIQTYLGTQDGADLMAMAAGFLHLAPTTLGGIFTMLIGLLIWILRAKSEWSLTELAAGKDETTPQRRASDTEHGYVRIAVLYLLIILATFTILFTVT